MNRARIICVLLSAVACMVLAAPSPALAKDHETSTSDLVKIREEGVKKVREKAAHSIKNLRKEGAEAVKKIAKERDKNHPKGDKIAKEVEKATEKLNKECAKGVKEVLKERDHAIEKLTERGGPQRMKGRVWRVAQRRMNAIIRITNEQIALVNAAAA